MPGRPAPDFDLIPAVHTPIRADGRLWGERVADQAAFLAALGVRTVFVAGTTGEGLSLTTDERRELAEAWLTAAAERGLRVLLHVGCHAIDDAAALAAHAQARGAHGIAAAAPSFVKPGNTAELVAVCAAVAAGAPDTPFYYYDIPALSGVALPMPAWLETAAAEIPNLGGIKDTNPDLAGLQECLALAGDRWQIYYGNDESLLAARALGCPGAVGSTYNFAQPLAAAAVRAFDQGDLPRARRWQLRIVQLVRTVQRHHFLSANKSIMAMLGVELGAVRLPLPPCSEATRAALRADLEQLGFFAWLRDAGAEG